jgi:ferrous iron transport protein A
LGITIGSKVTCLVRLPGGTIILQKNRQEIAIGYDLAKKIKIKFLKENK